MEVGENFLPGCPLKVAQYTWGWSSEDSRDSSSFKPSSLQPSMEKVSALVVESNMLICPSGAVCNEYWRGVACSSTPHSPAYESRS